MLGDPLNLRQKAHVQQSVGFVEHEHFDLGQVNVALFEMVEESTRRSNDDIDAAPQTHDLLRHSCPAVDRNTAQAGALAVKTKVSFDLHGQLTCRNQDQSAWITAIFVIKFVKNRNRIDGCFAAAGLGTGNKVLPSKSCREGKLLDVGQVDVLCGRQIPLNRVPQGKFCESLQNFGAFRPPQRVRRVAARL